MNSEQKALAKPGLPTNYNDLLAAIHKNRETVAPAVAGQTGGDFVAYLKLNHKTGAWTYGRDNAELDPGRWVVVEAASFRTGVTKWQGGLPVDEKWVDIWDTDAKPILASDLDGPIVDGLKDGWKRTVKFKGELAGAPIEYSVMSVGGARAWETLKNEVMAHAAAQLEVGELTHPNPVVALDTDHYTHRQYGKQFVPVFRIVAWRSADGEWISADPTVVSAEAVDDAVDVPFDADPPVRAVAKTRKPRR